MITHFARHRFAGGLFAVLLAGASACQAGPPPDEASRAVTTGFLPGTIHPTRENLPDRRSLAASVRMRDGAGGDAGLGRLARSLRDARPLWTLGTMDGDEATVFGHVEDIVAGEDGRLFVLDSRFNNIRVYDAAARPLAVFGRPGRGPEEFMAPEALKRDSGGRLVVADRHNRIKIFEPNDATFRSSGSISVPFVPEDFCLLDDRIFVQGVRRDGGVIHSFTEAGDSVLSFGPAYRTGNWLVRNQLSDGPIACSPEGGTVVMMFKYLPVVYGYSADGRLKWVTELADFHPITITEDVDGQGRPEVGFEPRPDGHDIAESLLAVPGGAVLVQTARHTPESLRQRRDFAELRTYLLSASTGQGIYVGSGLPRIRAVAAGRAYAAVNDPFPQVRTYQLSEGGVIE
jgi:hypothetical protein